MRPKKSYEEYDLKKVEKRSKEFLKRVMGEERFDRLQKNGKIEIEVDSVNNKSEKTVYELFTDGRIINKTKNQSYCIVSNSSDYPINDMVAIKYAWLTHRSDIAEKVANKTGLYTHTRFNDRPIPVSYGDFIRDMEQRGWNRQQVSNPEDIATNSTPWYGDYVDYLSGNGWHRELIAIDQNNTNLAATRNVNKCSTNTVIDVRCPSGMKMSIMGTQQIPRGADNNLAYSLGLYIIDNNGEEILNDNKIRITKIKPSEGVIQLARLFYEDIKMTKDGDASYRFKQGIELNGEEHFVIYIVNSQNDVSSANVKFKVEADLWARDM